MKRLSIFLLIIYCFGSCQKQEKTVDDLLVLNQIFPQLTKEMKLSIVESFAFPPPLPNFIGDDTLFHDIKPDSCIRREDLANYLKTLEKYYFYLQDYYFENYAFRSDSIEAVLGISDTLYSCMNCFSSEPEYVKKEFPKEYLYVFSNKNEYEENIIFDKTKLTNTGVFKIFNASDLKWTRENNSNFWHIKRDHFISGILVISKIRYNESKDRGVFYCTAANSEVEPYSMIICVKLKNNKWTIDKTIFRM